MPALIIADVAVRTDAAGRYCLNDLHRAAGGASKDRPSKWLDAEKTQDLIREIEAGKPASEQNQALRVVKGGDGWQGTFIAKELVYAYAMWISPAFHLKVIRAYDALVTQQPHPGAIDIRDPKQLAVVALQLVEVNRELQEKIDVMQVAVDAHERIAQASAGSRCVTDAAKDLQVRPKDLFAWLQANRWIYRRAGGSGWLAYQDRIQSGLLEHKVRTVERPDGTEKVVENLLVTPKGLAKLADLLGRPVPKIA